jgi:MFS family permease
MPSSSASVLPPSRRHAPSTFSSLRHPNYRLWFFGQTLSLMGTWMQWVAQGWLVYQLTGSELALGTISFLGSVPTLFLMLPAGAFCDRVSRQRLLLLTQTGMMLLAFIMAGLAFLRVLEVWHIGVLAFGVGICNSFDAPARLSLVVDMVEDRADLPNAIGLNSAMFNMARIVGPAVGGILLAAVGATWCFMLNGLSFLAVILALRRMRFPKVQRSAEVEPLMTQVQAGLRYVAGHELVRTIIVVAAVSALFGMSYYTLMPAYAANVLHVGETGLGTLNAATGIGALIASLAVASLTGYQHKGRLLLMGSVVFPLGLLLFASSPSFGFSAACLMVIGFAFVIQNGMANTLIQIVVPDSLRGRVTSVFSLSFFGTAPFASLFAGAMAQALGIRVGLSVGAGLTLACALYVLLRVPALARLKG